MGQRHISKLARLLTAEVRGRFAAERTVRYDEDKKDDHVFSMIDRKSGKDVASMVLRSLPGCCGVALFHSFKGDDDALVEMLNAGLRAAKRAGFGQALYTLRTGASLLDRIPVDPTTDSRLTFLNGKTGNSVVTVLRHLEQPPPKKGTNAGE